MKDLISLSGHSFKGIDNKKSTVAQPQSGSDFVAEFYVSWRVDEINEVFLVLKRNQKEKQTDILFRLNRQEKLSWISL